MRRGGKALTVMVGIVAACTAVGLALLWPSSPSRAETTSGPERQGATVTGIERGACTGTDIDSAAQDACVRVTVRLTEGPDRGQAAGFDAIGIPLSLDDDILVLPSGDTRPGADRYAFADFSRTGAVWWLVILFAAAVCITARWKGLRALAGLAASLAIVLAFIVPAMLDGRPPVAVALVGALAAMFVTIPLAHGLGPRAIAAMAGTALALGFTVAAAWWGSDLTHLTGMTSEDAIVLRNAGVDLSLSALVIAGVVIAVLGVLDDLTVSQASTVMALRSANPTLGARALFRLAMRVGHDHVASTVNTLVLAYAGTALPVLLVLSFSGISFADALNTEIIAREIVSTVIGSTALVLAAPLTTLIASWLAVQVPADSLDGDAHGHAH